MSYGRSDDVWTSEFETIHRSYDMTHIKQWINLYPPDCASNVWWTPMKQAREKFCFSEGINVQKQTSDRPGIINDITHFETKGAPS